MRRRDFLKTAAAGVGGAALGVVGASGRVAAGPGIAGEASRAAAAGSSAKAADFRFAHLPDTHIQPELRAAEGCRQCFEHATAQAPDFAIMGGDLVFDVNETARPRADLVFDLYERALEALEMPVYHVVGNHDVYGISNNSGVSPSDPLYGKRMYEDRLGALHYTFDHQGWRFICLDSIGLRVGHARPYVGEVDTEQLAWLQDALRATGPEMPVVVATHIPILTAFWSYYRGTNSAPPASVVMSNGKELVDLLAAYNVKAVLQGHTHVREIIDYQGCQYITSGAVCGDWWKGARMGHPEGYGLASVRGGELEWTFHTYGFEAVAGG